MLDFGHVGSIGVHLSDGSSGRVGLGADGSLRASYGLTATTPAGSPSASPAPPRSTSPPARPRSTPTSAASACCGPATLAEFEATSFKPSELRLEAFHPMGTARIAADPREGVCAADGSVNGVDGLYVADASPLPDLGRRQPDDDHDRLRQAGRRRGRRASRGGLDSLRVAGVEAVATRHRGATEGREPGQDAVRRTAATRRRRRVCR